MEGNRYYPETVFESISGEMFHSIDKVSAAAAQRPLALFPLF